MNVRDITKLTDYPLIEKLAQALWEQETFGHGVAIMVGAGFSRCAATTYDTDKKLPIWRDLAKKLADELGESEHTDALRLAQMYQDYFGKTRLYDLLKNAVEDEIWEPTKLYQDLLTLPWSEVLTTNWDTLLERASKTIYEPIYDIVSKQEDLAGCHSPRIVKLHGTINVSNDLIFTQEDYRCYPQKYGIFVNFVRQVFVENELCLIGFSGDDPNFLQWIGWVRDNLQSNARRIYLVGALNLSAAKRKYLESLNVAPIDLYFLVKHFDNIDLRHKMANDFFLKQLSILKKKKIWEWQPTSLTSISEKNSISLNKKETNISPEAILETLIEDRKSYPEWIICPNALRIDFINQISEVSQFISDFSKLKESTRCKLLYELVWRYEKIFYYNIDKNLQTMLLSVCNPNNDIGLSKKHQLEIALYLLKCSRFTEKNSEQQEVINKTTNIIKDNSQYWSESIVEFAYHQILVAKEELNYPLIEELVDKINGTDPIWKLRKAYILSKIDCHKESANLIDNVYKELALSYCDNQNSIFILSRLAWACFLKSQLDMVLFRKNILEFSNSKYSQQKCDPYEIINYLERVVSEHLDKQREPMIEPTFEPGRYKDNSKTVHFVNSIQIHPAILFDMVSNTVGLPIKWGNFQFTKHIAYDVANFVETDYWQQFILITEFSNYDESKEIKKLFNRLRIAQISSNEVNKSVECCFKAIKFWMNKRINHCKNKQIESYAIDNLRVFIEILARFQTRLSSDEAKKYYRFALSIAKDEYFYHFWLKKSINNLLNYSLRSIPTSQYNELLVETLEFPIKEDWVNPIIEFPGKRNINKILDYEIDYLINNIRNKKQGSKLDTRIVMRLMPLIDSSFLIENEKDQLVFNIYGKDYEYKKLPYTKEVYPSFFLNIPPEENVKKIKDLIIYEVYSEEPSYDMAFLETLVNTLSYKKLLPSEMQSIQYFNYFIDWKRNDYSNSVDEIIDELFDGQDPDIISKHICHILYFITSHLPMTFLNQDNFDKIYKFYQDNMTSPYILRALIPFVLKNPEKNQLVISLIKKALKNKIELIVGDAAYAILEWGTQLSDKSVIRPLIDKLIYRVESGRLIGLINILQVINIMFNSGWLTNDDINILIENLPEIYNDSNYDNFSDDDSEAIIIFDIRKECVRLARDILKQRNEPIPALQNILDKAKNDALPEVRFAELNEYLR